MAIAQMNWGRMRFSLEDRRMSEFAMSLADIYTLAEKHKGFIWRIPDDEAAAQLQALGFDDKTSSTVSVWDSIEDLKDYTFESLHGQYLNRKNEWFEVVKGPQVVIWDADTSSRPTFKQAFERLEILKKDGPTQAAYGWPF